MKTLTVISLLFFSVSLVSAEKNKVRMAIAANLVPVMGELEKVFEAEHPGVDLELISGASGNLTAQIISGAPYDIFASADMEFPEKLKSMGLTVRGPEVYAEGLLVLFTVKNIDLTKGIGAVQDKQVEKISIANPDTAPYGKAAVNALKKAGIFTAVEKKFIYAGNISQAAQQIITVTDIGFTARSLMFDQSMAKYKENINWITLPDKIAPPLKQGIVLLPKGSGDNDALEAYKFILSEKAKKVFLKYGYR